MCEGKEEAQKITSSETLRKVSHLCEVDQTAQPSDVFIASTSPVTTKGHTVNAQVNGVAASLLVDTGSAITLIGGNLWEQCKQDHDTLEPWTKWLVSVDGSSVSVLGSCEVRITLSSYTFHHTVLVANTLTSEGILGVDFLQRNKCLVNLGENVLKVLGHSISIPLSHNTKEGAFSKQVDVVAAQTICVPARSELEILAEIHNSIDNGDTWLLEGKQVKDSPLVVARALVKPYNNTVLVRLLNPQSKPFTLHKKSRIAFMEPMDSLCICTADIPTITKTTPALTEEKRHILWNMVSSCHAELPDDERQKLFHLLSQFGDIFAGPQELPGRTSKLKHSIDTGDAHPVRQPVRRIPPARRSEVTELLKEMIEKDIIQPSSSPWASPIVLVKKKDGSTRFCIDYRKLNAITRKDAYPLPRIDETLDTLQGSKWFSTLDLASGYWQVELNEDSQDRTAFCTPNGLFEFKVLPFGLCNAPATFQRLMDLILSGLQWSACLVYLDDIIIVGKNFTDHLRNIHSVLSRIKEAGLKLQTTKCNFFKKAVSYLGHIVSEQGVAVDPGKVDKIKSWPTPTTSREVQQFLGLANYYRRFIRGFAQIAKPLHKLTEHNAAFKWTPECNEAFTTLRLRLTTTPVLVYPDFTKEFILDTDASNTAIGAVLSQVGQDGQEHVIAYGSRILTKSERQYCVTRRELLAVIVFTKHFRPYLLGRRFVLRTDHGSLQWLCNFKDPEGQVARWLEAIQELDFKIVHRKGQAHTNADALSRIPCRQCGRLPDDLTVLPDTSVGATTITGSASLNIQQQQRDDPILGPLIKAKLNNTPPPQGQQGTEAKRLLQLWDQLHLKQGILYCRFPTTNGSYCHDRMVVPAVSRSHILQELHEGKVSGHLGTAKTLGKLKERFYWPGHYNDTREWCLNCAVCATRKTPAPKPRAALVPVSVGFPLDLVAVDILGPLPESKSGNLYILVVGDYFTKWIEAYPIPNQEATTVGMKLVDEFFCRFSLPKQLHSDQGSQFESAIIATVCQLLQIDKTRTTPYHPQSDGLIERFNRTLLQMLTNCVDKHPFEWEEYVKKVCMAYNTSTQATTGYSPFFLMFGRKPRLPIDVMYGIPNDTSTLPTFVRKLKHTLTEAFDAARSNVSVQQERQQDVYNQRVHGSPHQPGTLVWLFNPVVPRGMAKKFYKPWCGPFKVITRLSDNTYKIKSTRKPFRTKVVHFDRLKTCLPGTRLPQMSNHVQPSQDDTSQTVPASLAPPGTNLELLDIDDHPPSFQSAAPSRYPQRDNRRPPPRFDNFIQH